LIEPSTRTPFDRTLRACRALTYNCGTAHRSAPCRNLSDFNQFGNKTKIFLILRDFCFTMNDPQYKKKAIFICKEFMFFGSYS